MINITRKMNRFSFAQHVCNGEGKFTDFQFRTTMQCMYTVQLRGDQRNHSYYWGCRSMHMYSTLYIQYAVRLRVAR